MRIFCNFIKIVGVAIILAGCATAPLMEIKESRPPAGLYYEVQRGDTLWKISKLYDIEVQDIVRANRLPDVTKISAGQKLFIPNAQEESTPLIANVKNDSVSFSWPIVGKIISYFGSKKGLVTNKGIDIIAEEGSHVVSADNGVVSFVDENMKGLGKTIIIDHENGYSTVYAHNSEILVGVGEKVEQNQKIAKVGRTGRATESYLHFQIRKGYEPQNPMYYLP